VNISGEPAAKIYDEIASELLEAVDYVCYYRRGDKTTAQPSSIIKIDERERITIIRS
jgi:L-threonylcarbamoyladenylate synthase